MSSLGGDPILYSVEEAHRARRVVIFSSVCLAICIVCLIFTVYMAVAQ